MFTVVEKFLSIDGEGPTAGQLAAFIRFQGCNLDCSWCDTLYAVNPDQDSEMTREQASAAEIYSYIQSLSVRNVTLTGGEPLIQNGIDGLLAVLNEDRQLLTHVETNGSISLHHFKRRYPHISFIVDFKLPSSGMTDRMNLDNLKLLDKEDVYKFVIADKKDLQYAYDIIQKNDLCSRTQVCFSPVQGRIDPAVIVDFMKENKLNRVRLQFQLHKLIWGADKRGV